MNTNAYLDSPFRREDERSTSNTQRRISPSKTCLSTNNHGTSTEIISSSANLSQKKQKISGACYAVVVCWSSIEPFECDKKRKHNENKFGHYSRSICSESTSSIREEDIYDSKYNALSTKNKRSFCVTLSSHSPSKLIMTDSTESCLPGDGINVVQTKFYGDLSIERFVAGIHEWRNEIVYSLYLLALVQKADNYTPTTEADQLEREGVESSFHPHEDDLDNYSVSSSASSQGHSSQPSSSDMNKQTPSTAGDNSSQSHQSSTTTESDASCDSKDDDDNDNTLLEQLLLRVMRDHEVAVEMSHALSGKLECSPPDNTELFDSTGFSLLRHLELQDCSMIDNQGEFTTCAPQSSSNSTPSNTLVASSSNTTGTSGGSSGLPTKKDQVPPGEDRGQLTKSRKFEKSNSSKTIEPRPLRCFFNALWPEHFCVNQGRKKFRACAGPGWNTIHHLKEHLKSHHKSKAKPLKCNRCQNEFKDQSSLEDHEVTVDCVIRCPDCDEEFEKKSMRQTHQQEAHRQDTEDSILLEYNESVEKLMKDQSKAYVDSLKKGKARSDVALEQWVDKNFAQYQVGRLDKPNPRLELGQWYIMCRALSELGPNGKIPDHPFYDYSKTHSELVAEKILLIYESTIDTKLRVLGPPPANLQGQRDWYKNNLRESLQIAAETRLIPPNAHDSSSSEGQEQDFGTCITPQASFQPDFIGGVGYGYTGMETPMTTPHQSQHDQGIGGQESDMTVTPIQYSMMPEPPNFLQSTGSGATVPSFGMYQYQNIPHATEHFGENFDMDNLGNINDSDAINNMNLPQGYFPNGPQYSSNWHGQQGSR